MNLEAIFVPNNTNMLHYNLLFKNEIVYVFMTKMVDRLYLSQYLIVNDLEGDGQIYPLQ